MVGPWVSCHCSWHWWQVCTWVALFRLCWIVCIACLLCLKQAQSTVIVVSARVTLSYHLVLFDIAQRSVENKKIDVMNGVSPLPLLNFKPIFLTPSHDRRSNFLEEQLIWATKMSKIWRATMMRKKMSKIHE